ncbi:MAG: sugar phosphate isomerase/epimerase family protein [Armatimonadota bacterium]|nr:sugar phosphate isomerase/epimerase family protein [Armatimonadota bacterium]
MDMNRVSSCTYPLRDREVEYVFRVTAAAGVHKVDLWGRMPHFSPDPAVCNPVALQEKARAAGVRIANLGTYAGAGFGSDDEGVQAAAMEEMVATIDRAAELGARSIRVRPGEKDDPALIPRLVPWFKKSAEYAEKRGIYLGMENHAGSIAGNLDACTELCERVGSRFFGVLYEPCNLMHGGVDYKEAFERFGPYIVHLHLKDGRRVDGKFQRTHLGEGDIDVGWVLESLARAGYQGDYALEYEICDIEPLETGLAKWVRYIQQF